MDLQQLGGHKKCHRRIVWGARQRVDAIRGRQVSAARQDMCDRQKRS